jgi:hypothetical protein
MRASHSQGAFVRHNAISWFEIPVHNLDRAQGAGRTLVCDPTAPASVAGGTLCNRRALLAEPLLDRFDALLTGFFDGFLWREAPALEVLAHGANGQVDLEILLDEQYHCSAVPQGNFQLELFGAVLADQALDV